MASDEGYIRLSFQESMDLVPLASEDQTKTGVKRYMSTRAAWLPGSDLPNIYPPSSRGKHGAAFGGNVYSQGALATCRALAEAEDKRGLASNERLGIHVGYYSFRPYSGRHAGVFIITSYPWDGHQVA